MSAPEDHFPSASGPLAPEQTPWSRRSRDTAAILWPSFLCAAGASILCFAFFDPADLGLERMRGYALGFFFFWILAAASASVTVYLLRTAREER